MDFIIEIFRNNVPKPNHLGVLQSKMYIYKIYILN